jgi:hypothetical protein
MGEMDSEKKVWHKKLNTRLIEKMWLRQVLQNLVTNV